MRTKAPWYFEIVAKHIMANRRGGWRMLRGLQYCGMLKGVAEFQLRDGSIVEISLDTPHVYDPDLPDWYEPLAIKCVADAVNGYGLPFVLFDCGADSGLYSRLLIAETQHIMKVIAFEPNRDMYRVLCRNLTRERIGIPSESFVCGVADFNGFGKLVAPPNSKGKESFFIEHSDVETEITVRTLDSIGLPTGNNLVIKLDIEGAELSALKGAQATLRDAGHLIIQIEAHPKVMQRTGIEPMDIVNYLRKLRPFSVTACGNHTDPIYPITRFDIPLFEQLPADVKYDLVLIAPLV